MSSGTNLLIWVFLPDFGDIFCDFTELILRRRMMLQKKMEQQMFKISDNKIRDGETIYLVGGLEHEAYFSIYWEQWSQLSKSYFSEGWLNHQPDLYFILFFFSIIWMDNNPPHWLSYFSEGWLNHQPDIYIYTTSVIGIIATIMI